MPKSGHTGVCLDTNLDTTATAAAIESVFLCLAARRLIHWAATMGVHRNVEHCGSWKHWWTGREQRAVSTKCACNLCDGPCRLRACCHWGRAQAWISSLLHAPEEIHHLPESSEGNKLYEQSLSEVGLNACENALQLVQHLKIIIIRNKPWASGYLQETILEGKNLRHTLPRYEEITSINGPS